MEGALDATGGSAKELVVEADGRHRVPSERSGWIAETANESGERDISDATGYAS